MPLILTEQDVQLLLLGKASPEARAEVAGKVAATLSSRDLTPQELSLAQDIIRAMVQDISVEVRRALAEQLKATPQLPRDAALRMARDEDSVALPILQFSTVLTDEDLMLVIEESGDTKQGAIASRPIVSSVVADALIEKASETTVARLVSNPGATLRERSMNRVLARFPYSEPVHKGLIARPQLPILVAEQLVELVADNLRQELAERHELKPETLADIILDSRERATLMISGRAGTERNIEQLVVQMHANGRLTPSLMLRALCTGDLGFFEAALAVMAGVPLINARLLIHDAGRMGLKSIYDKAGLPARLLPAIRTALDVLHDTALDGDTQDLARFRNTVIERVVTQYPDMAEDDLDYLVGKIETIGPRAPDGAAA